MRKNISTRLFGRHTWHFWIIFPAVASLVTANLALAASGIGVSISSSSYVMGQGNPPTVSVTGFSNEGATVDVHIGLISPNNTVYEYPNWVPNALTPSFKNVALPANFNLGQTPIFDLGRFPSFSTGTWTAVAVMTQPGTLNVVGTLGTAPFTVTSQSLGSGNYYGNLNLTQMQSSLSGSTTVSTSAGASFNSFTGDESLISSYIGQQPGLGQCVFNEISITSPVGLTVQSLDAGNVIPLQAAGNSTVNLNKVSQSGQIYYGPSGSSVANTFYQGGVAYTFQGTGGTQIGPFNVTVTAPAALRLSQPTATTTSINSASSLNLVWNGNNGQGEVDATMSGFNIQTSKSYNIICRFVDGGNGTISANLISQLKSSIGSGVSLPPGVTLPPGTTIPGLGASASLSVSRTNIVQFNTSSSQLKQGTANISTGVTMQLQLQ
jgi:hypothetical protein